MSKKNFAVPYAKIQMLRNGLNKEAGDFADAVLEVITALQNDDEEHTLDELRKEIERVSDDFKQVEEMIAGVKSEILNSVREMVATNENPVSRKVANEVCGVLAHSKSKLECLNALREVATANGLTIREKANDITGITYQELVDYSLQIKQDDADEVFDALKQTPFATFFYGDLDAENAAEIAKQWDKASAENVKKDLQTLALEGKTLATKYIYKRQRVSNEDLDSAEEAGQLNELLASGRAELRKSVKSLAVRAMLIGDTVNPAGKQLKSFETIGTKTATDAFTTIVNPAAAEVTLSDILKAVKAVKTERKWLVITSELEVKLRTMIYAAGGTQTIIGLDDLAKMVGVERVINKDYLSKVAGLHAIVFDPDEYWVKTKKVIDVTYPEFSNNSLYLQYEMNMAGGIHGLQSTAVLRAAAGK